MQSQPQKIKTPYVRISDAFSAAKTEADLHIAAMNNRGELAALEASHNDSDRMTHLWLKNAYAYYRCILRGEPFSKLRDDREERERRERFNRR